MASYGEMALVSSMQYLAESQASVAHNLANANTSSFKRSTAIAREVPSDFASMLGEPLPTLGYGSEVDWSSGTPRPTNEKMHVAINGDQFFRARTRDGQQTYFTRRGELVIDNEGYLSISSGHRLLGGNDQEIFVGPIGDLVINSNGEIQDGTPGADGGAIGKVGLFQKPASDQLMATGEGLYRDLSQNPPQIDPLGSVSQGSLEQSNVEPVGELVRMIEIQRKFQAASRAMVSIGRIQQSYATIFNR